ncbi:hypothetical protein F5I97DRAFT_750500 [Phlebopus sp. FC_14]|nr:hypothetical protein F5I97DRAFT_750500 [Phlebopus sp. FC_14]
MSAFPPPPSQQDVAPLPQLRTNEEQPLAPDRVPDSPAATASGIALLTGEPRRREASPTYAWPRNSTLSPPDTQTFATTSDVQLPNPYDPFTTPARVASLGSISATSPSAISATYGVSAASSSTAALASSVPERRASALHADLLLYQKQLESEHNKESLEPRVEPLDPPPSYTS